MYKSTTVKQSYVIVPGSELEAKIREIGATPDNLISIVVNTDGTTTYQRTWATAEAANEWVTWVLTHSGVVSSTVEEIV